MKYIFGPVNSRRLGISLGIDLVPYKTCSLNCIYCECGATTDLTTCRKEYAPIDDVLKELDAALSSISQLDVITFSGSGEPTLHSGIGVIIQKIKERYPQYKVCLLSNGTTLWNSNVRKNIINADIVIPSLDAVGEEAFQKLLRPAPGLTAAKVVAGIETFAREYKGNLILEIFIVPGVNDSRKDLALLKEAVLRINPRTIQLNRLDRPGSEEWVRAAELKELEDIKSYLAPLHVEIVASPKSVAPYQSGKEPDVDRICAVLKRRPSTFEDLQRTLGIEEVSLKSLLQSLLDENVLAVEEQERGVFYRLY